MREFSQPGRRPTATAPRRPPNVRLPGAARAAGPGRRCARGAGPSSSIRPSRLNRLIRRLAVSKVRLSMAPISSRCGSQIRPSASACRQLVQQPEHAPARRAGGQFGDPGFAVFQRALPAQHQLAHQGGFWPQAVHQVRRDAAQLHRRAGHGLVGIGPAQQHFLADQVAAAGQAHDAAVAALGDALEAHDALAHRVENGAARAGLNSVSPGASRMLRCGRGCGRAPPGRARRTATAPRTCRPRRPAPAGAACPRGTACLIAHGGPVPPAPGGGGASSQSTHVAGHGLDLQFGQLGGHGVHDGVVVGALALFRTA